MGNKKCTLLSIPIHPIVILDIPICGIAVQAMIVRHSKHDFEMVAGSIPSIMNIRNDERVSSIIMNSSKYNCVPGNKERDYHLSRITETFGECKKLSPDLAILYALSLFETFENVSIYPIDYKCNVYIAKELEVNFHE